VQLACWLAAPPGQQHALRCQRRLHLRLLLHVGKRHQVAALGRAVRRRLLSRAASEVEHEGGVGGGGDIGVGSGGVCRSVCGGVWGGTGGVGAGVGWHGASRRMALLMLQLVLWADVLTSSTHMLVASHWLQLDAMQAAETGCCNWQQLHHCTSFSA
jgi:hypothetical protein